MTDSTNTPDVNEPAEEQSMITVARCDSEMEAEMKAVRLRDAGIDVTVVSGGSLGISADPTKGAVGVLVLVPESSVDAAEAILQEAVEPAEASDSGASEDADDEPFVPRVPWPARIASLVVLAMILLILIGGVMTGVSLIRWIFNPSEPPVE